jgi:hypothetical protein
MTIKVVFLIFLLITYFRISYVTPLKYVLNDSQREAEPLSSARDYYVA